jgi:hypothetical protein
MAKKEKTGLTQRHLMTLSEVSGKLSMLDVYGKVVKDAAVQPQTSGILHPAGTKEEMKLAQIVGYLDQGRCVRLSEPQVIAMPKPDGPAGSCGWDPAEYVVWKNLPRNWTTLHFQLRTAGLHEALSSGAHAAMDERQLRADQIEAILRDCIPLAGGSSAVIDLSKTLQQYGLDKDGVVVLAGLVIGDADHGVRRFDFELPAGSLDSLTVGSKISEVEDTIQDKAVHS